MNYRHTKPTDKHRYLLKTSCHPYKHPAYHSIQPLPRNPPHMLTDTFFDNRSEELLKNLVKCGYSHSTSHNTVTTARRTGNYKKIYFGKAKRLAKKSFGLFNLKKGIRNRYLLHLLLIQINKCSFYEKPVLLVFFDTKMMELVLTKQPIFVPVKM